MNDSYAKGLLGHSTAGEYERLLLLERLCDPGTIRILERLPITPSWACVDVGAGTGSLARWLAERCPEGQITATDLDTRFLESMPRPENLAVSQQDVTTTDFPANSLDLVHARAVLTHLPHPEGVVRQMASWLKPGGFLVIEDPSYLPAQASPYPDFAALLVACERLLERTHGTDNSWARRIPRVMADAGLTNLKMSADLSVCGRDDLEDAYWRQCFSQAFPALVASGLMTEQQINRAMEHLDRPEFTDVAWMMVSCWGQLQ
ncbi:class I SAM-dependent methyltransferase [Streptacidiphilus pinicola]|uniref:class I SAM-dependent methyltransferase n=1 Tax=Streptacidiphilus pinicola TaxID=2219663 RepID=UPI001403FF77|nr:class I SAM-dependent methyltransferase [Streptacidiphilus pinicola]